MLATAFASANDTDQAKLLNSASRELYVLCRGQLGYEHQLYAIAKQLDKDGVAFITNLYEFIQLRTKDITT